MQQKQPATARTPQAARRTERRMAQAGTIPAQHAKQQHLAASFRHDATRHMQRVRYNVDHTINATQRRLQGMMV
jgi:predicted AAA+ superfamily ATPase